MMHRTWVWLVPALFWKAYLVVTKEGSLPNKAEVGAPVCCSDNAGCICRRILGNVAQHLTLRIHLNHGLHVVL